MTMPDEPSPSPVARETPRNSTEALALMSHLRDLASQERSAAVHALLANGERAGWQGIIAELCDPPDEPGGPRVIELLRMLEDLGLSRDEAKTHAARLLDRSEQREAWSHWLDITDRDELRLRLEVLARCTQWSEGLVDFVTFCFRASVSDLYQEAAIALGRHLHHSPGLRSYLAKFSKQRSVQLDQPIQLNGQRTMRRLLIALNAARGTEIPELSLARESLPIVRDDNGAVLISLPENPSDLFALLLAADQALTYERDRQSIEGIVDQLLKQVGSLDAAMITRAVMREFGKLLVRRHTAQTETFWWALFSNQRDVLRQQARDSFARRVAALRRIDETLRTVALLPEPHAEPIVQRLMNDCSEDEQRFIRLRLLTWVQRERCSLPTWCDDLRLVRSDVNTHHDNSSEHADPATVLDWLERSLAGLRFHAGADMLIPREANHRQLRLLAHLLAPLASHSLWLSHDESTRALITMLILDLAQYVQAPGEQVSMLLARYGFRVRMTDRIVKPSGIGRDSPSATTTNVLLRLLAWEKPGAEDLIDTNMLHRIEDVRVLVSLVPTKRRSPLLAVLADAFEHQIRWRLRGEEEFSPDAFLSLISVRRPHRALYVALAAVCADRTYTDATGNAVAIHDVIGEYAAEPDDEAVFNHSPALAASIDTVFARSVSRLRERIQELTDRTTDIRVRLGQLADIIGETPDGQQHRSGTLLALLHQLHEPDVPVIRDGYPAWSDDTPAALERSLGEQIARLRAATHALLPASWAGGEPAREAAGGVRNVISAMRSHICRSLPAAEGELFDHALNSLDNEMIRWGEIIEHVLDRWPAQRLHPHELDFQACNEALNDVRHVDEQILRPHLLDLLWRSLRNWAAADGPDDPWSREQVLLDWAIARDEAKPSPGCTGPGTPAGAWGDAPARTWSELLEAAMDRQEEQRVRVLVEDDRYSALRVTPHAADVLERAHRWCLDRYLLHAARRARSDARTSTQQSATSWWRTFGAFLGHYSSIWIALLIGSILMLDFGDAWAEMAEPAVGDVRGIALTFLIGAGGAFAYIYWNLRQKSRLSPGESPGTARRSHLVRASSFAVLCLVYTLAVTSFLWWLLSETDGVVQGVWAIGHIIVWSGFAMFVGVFFGLIAEKA